VSSLSFLKVYFISTNQDYLIPKKYWGYVPNWNAIGLAFVVPQVYYSIAMAVGSSVNYFWMLRNPAGYDMYMFAISAGMLAGEGLGGVFQALLAIIGVDGGSKSFRMPHFIHTSDFSSQNSAPRLVAREWNSVVESCVVLVVRSWICTSIICIPTKFPSSFITYNVWNEFDETESSESVHGSWRGDL